MSNLFVFNKCSTLWTTIVLALFVACCLAEICPDHKKSCRKGQTCCDDKQGGYGCCPYDNATCCSDGMHCCPEGTVCDLEAGRCRRRSLLKQLTLVPATDSDAETILGNGLGDADLLFRASFKQQCPDQKQSCPSNYTCCPDPNTSFSCCPYVNATCCSDRIHCCPQGSICGSGRCE